MIRALALTDSHLVNGLGNSDEATTARNELCDYLYLVADCLTVVFYESESLGLSDIDLVEAANRYLDEARDSLATVSWSAGDGELPQRLGSPDEIPVAATELSRRARQLEDTGFHKSLS